jgi:hypothetical protein
MTGDPEAAATTATTPPAVLFGRATVVLAALVLAAAALSWFGTEVTEPTGWVIAVVVMVLGVAVFVAARRPGPLGAALLRGAGGGLAVLGVHLFATALMVSISLGPGADRALLVLVLFGLPALATVLLAATGSRVWAGAAGILVVTVAVSVVGALLDDQSDLAIPVLLVAVVLTAVAVLAPAGAAWAGLVGAAAATATTHAAGAGFSMVGAFVLQQLPVDLGDGLPGQPATWVQVVCAFGGLLLAAVLVLLATVRRDPATGLVAASVLVLPSGVVLSADADWWPFVWVPLLVLLVALAGLRLPAVRATLANVPAVLRERGPSGATAAAACAAVGGAAVVVFAVHGLDELGLSWTLTGVLAAVLLLVACALAYFLPGAAGAALAVVALVGLFLARPWANILLSAPTEPGTGVLGMIELATVVVAGWTLCGRHSRPGVWAAATYLMLGTLPDVLAPLFGLTGDRSPEPTGHAMVLVLPLVLLGLPAAIMAWGHAAARWQAVGAVVVGATLVLPLRLNIAIATQGDGHIRAPLTGPIDPLAPTDLLGSSAHLDSESSSAVLFTALFLAAVSVLSVVRRLSTPLVVVVALAVLKLWPMAEYQSRDRDDDLLVLGPLFVTLAVLLMVGGGVLARHTSRERVH